MCVRFVIIIRDV